MHVFLSSLSLFFPHYKHLTGTTFQLGDSKSASVVWRAGNSGSGADVVQWDLLENFFLLRQGSVFLF